MKKLIAISMVLAMATVASAGVYWELSYDPATLTASIVLVGEDIAQFDLGTPSIVSSVNGTFSGMTTNAGFDFTSLATKNGFAPDDLNKVMGAKGLIAPGAPAFSGDIWTCAFTFDAPLVAYVIFDVGVAAYAKDSTGASMAIDFPHPIPEPMTMALLGLGGLFLRRRRA